MAKAKKAYIYISGNKNNKVYISGNTCYEVSKKIPGIYSFDEAKRIIETVLGKDWRLPNKDELNIIYTNLKCTGQIEDKDWYLSSSDEDNSTAWCQRFSNGYQDIYDKYSLGSVRAVRIIRRYKK